MSEPVYFTTLILFFGSIVTIFALRYFAMSKQARAKIASDEAYRALAEKAVGAQSQSAQAFAALQTDLSALKASVAAVEKVLKTVE